MKKLAIAAILALPLFPLITRALLGGKVAASDAAGEYPEVWRTVQLRIAVSQGDRDNVSSHGMVTKIHKVSGGWVQVDFGSTKAWINCERCSRPWLGGLTSNLPNVSKNVPVFEIKP